MIKAGSILQASSYQALLQRQEWKSFATGIRRSRSNACECCRRTNVATQVHHIFYVPNSLPWEADSKDVILLCAPCYKALHEHLRTFRQHVFRFLRPEHFEVLNKALALGLTTGDPLEFVHAVLEMASSPGSIKRFAYANMGGKPPESQDAYNATERGYDEKERH